MPFRTWKRLLFSRSLGRRKNRGWGTGKIYSFSDEEKDGWANLFGYMGSEENVRLKFAVDRIGVTLDDVDILYEDSLNSEAWDKFISSLKGKEWREKKDKNQNRERQEPERDQPALEEAEVVVPPLERKETLWSGRYRWVALVGAIVVVLGAVSFAIRRTHPKPDPNNVASIEKMAFPLPDKPSIAVLPFVNMSGDPKQEFLCDGMTEEIITALSKVPRMFVIARNSTSLTKESR